MKDKKEKKNSSKEKEVEVTQTPEDGVVEDVIDTAEAADQKEIEELQKINADLLDRLQRTLAEFDNFRKRTMKEKSQMYNDGVGDTVEKLLPILDNLERAVASFDSKEDSIYKGFEMILRQMEGILGTMGVEPINSVGETFNTTYHFAVAHVEDEQYGDSVVIEEMQKGYKLKEKVIRCSMVKVAN